MVIGDSFLKVVRFRPVRERISFLFFYGIVFVLVGSLTFCVWCEGLLIAVLTFLRLAFYLFALGPDSYWDTATTVFGFDTSLSQLFGVASIVGTWAVLSRCSVSGWKALVPFYGEWCVAKCATSDERLLKHYVYVMAGVVFGVLVAATVTGRILFDSASSYGHGVLVTQEWFLIFAVLFAVLCVWWIVLRACAYVRLAHAFDRSSAFAAGLLLVPGVFFCILGFDKSHLYRGPQAM